MEILVVSLLILAVAAIALAAKHGAEAAQTRRDERWGGFSPPPGRPLGPPADRPDLPAPAPRSTTSTAPAPGGKASKPSGEPSGRAAEPAGRSAKTPPLRPPEAAPAPAVRSGGPGPARAVLRAFRRSDDDGGGDGDGKTAPRRGERSVAVAPRPASRIGGAPALSRAGEARRAVGSAAGNATATARAVRATASAALRRQPAPIDINSASADDLQSLPGVGIRAAQRIVAHRESHGDFASVEDLGQVEGFDQHRVSRLAPRATV